MSEISYACPNCNHRFWDENSLNIIKCPRCKSKFEINWMTKGRQKCGIADNTLICFWGATGCIYLPECTIKIGTGVFEKRWNLTEIVLPNSLQEIGESAFHSCYRLQNVKFPNQLKIIRKNAFCFTGIQKLFIPKTVELIEEDAFLRCSLIKEIIVDEDNPYYYVENENLIDRRTKQILATCCKSKVFYHFSLASNVYIDYSSQEFNIISITEYEKQRISKALKEVSQDENLFFVCEADTPINGITYMQGIGGDDDIYLVFNKLNSDSDEDFENWARLCNLDEALNYLYSFLRGEFVPNFDKWELS